ncbi:MULTISPECIES: mandelate racemase/muconate lactonizing enzyme family protein [unclassified Sporosarcina]|uniref:mandelate racemase/muconate lactonizing enzyme family protein n=1 Tax=unclassified Sporosarcina TaxID=2647733 RepID=UPI00203EA6F1|nr:MULTISPECIES: mandelate racemase/muconate lactonizing enzyme family protein [unclassified Sporosarcina]GKV65913.1 dehydratase [Sporosarcina sp. NCCP-2331]GLB56087.1 dehydratase [Sporosarcina sp. NCCP-2378]
MIITKVETIKLKEHPRNLWIRIYTDEGIVGLGETNPKIGPVESMIHDVCAELLLGQNPLEIEKIWNDFYLAFNHHGYAGTEMRALSGIDIALWDILGKVAGLPVYRLLGGASREKIKVYNTCVGYMSNNDRDRFLTEPEKLAEELLSQGITVMKIWPFDELSREHGGQYISPDLLRKGIEPIQRIRKSLGSEMEIALEGHGRWNLPSAKRVLRSLEEYDLLWSEDLIRPDRIQNLKELKNETSIPVAASERLFTRFEYSQLMEEQAADIIIADIAWSGGISEVKKIANQAEIYQLPFAPHNCGGPVLHAATAHLCYNIPNLWMMETVRSFIDTHFNDIASGIPKVIDGYLKPSDKPGLGIELRPTVLERDDVLVRVSHSSNTDASEKKVYITSSSGDPWKTSASKV